MQINNGHNQQQQKVGTVYLLKLISVSLKIKFPCKMFLTHQGIKITKQVDLNIRDIHHAANQRNIFQFDEQITLHLNDQQDFQLLIHLKTTKGSTYQAGIIKIKQQQLSQAEGRRQSFTLPVTKSLDSEAFCLLEVRKIVHAADKILEENSIQLQKNNSFNKESASLSQIQNVSIRLKFVESPKENKKHYQLTTYQLKKKTPIKILGQSSHNPNNGSSISQVALQDIARQSQKTLIYQSSEQDLGNKLKSRYFNSQKDSQKSFNSSGDEESRLSSDCGKDWERLQMIRKRCFESPKNNSSKLNIQSRNSPKDQKVRQRLFKQQSDEFLQIRQQMDWNKLSNSQEIQSPKPVNLLGKDECFMKKSESETVINDRKYQKSRQIMKNSVLRTNAYVNSPKQEGLKESCHDLINPFFLSCESCQILSGKLSQQKVIIQGLERRLGLIKLMETDESNLKQTLMMKQQLIITLEQKLRKSISQNSSLQQLSQQLQIQKKGLMKLLQERDSKISIVQEDFNTACSQLQKKDRILEEQEDEIQRLRREIRSLRNELMEQQNVVNQKELEEMQILSRHKRQLAQLTSRLNRQKEEQLKAFMQEYTLIQREIELRKEQCIRENKENDNLKHQLEQFQRDIEKLQKQKKQIQIINNQLQSTLTSQQQEFHKLKSSFQLNSQSKNLQLQKQKIQQFQKQKTQQPQTEIKQLNRTSNSLEQSSLDSLMLQRDQALQNFLQIKREHEYLETLLNQLKQAVSKENKELLLVKEATQLLRKEIQCLSKQKLALINKKHQHEPQNSLQDSNKVSTESINSSNIPPESESSFGIPTKCMSKSSQLNQSPTHKNSQLKEQQSLHKRILRKKEDQLQNLARQIQQLRLHLYKTEKQQKLLKQQLSMEEDEKNRVITEISEQKKRYSRLLVLKNEVEMKHSKLAFDVQQMKEDFGNREKELKYVTEQLQESIESISKDYEKQLSVKQKEILSHLSQIHSLERVVIETKKQVQKSKKEEKLNKQQVQKLQKVKFQLEKKNYTLSDQAISFSQTIEQLKKLNSTLQSKNYKLHTDIQLMTKKQNILLATIHESKEAQKQNKKQLKAMQYIMTAIKRENNKCRLRIKQLARKVLEKLTQAQQKNKHISSALHQWIKRIENSIPQQLRKKVHSLLAQNSRQNNKHGRQLSYSFGNQNSLTFLRLPSQKESISKSLNSSHLNSPHSPSASHSPSHKNSHLRSRSHLSNHNTRVSMKNQKQRYEEEECLDQNQFSSIMQNNSKVEPLSPSKVFGSTYGLNSRSSYLGASLGQSQQNICGNRQQEIDLGNHNQSIKYHQDEMSQSILTEKEKKSNNHQYEVNILHIDRLQLDSKQYNSKKQPKIRTHSYISNESNQRSPQKRQDDFMPKGSILKRSRSQVFPIKFSQNQVNSTISHNKNNVNGLIQYLKMCLDIDNDEQAYRRVIENSFQHLDNANDRLILGNDQGLQQGRTNLPMSHSHSLSLPQLQMSLSPMDQHLSNNLRSIGVYISTLLDSQQLLQHKTLQQESIIEQQYQTIMRLQSQMQSQGIEFNEFMRRVEDNLQQGNIDRQQEVVQLRGENDSLIERVHAVENQLYQKVETLQLLSQKYQQQQKVSQQQQTQTLARLQQQLKQKTSQANQLSYQLCIQQQQHQKEKKILTQKLSLSNNHLINLQNQSNKLQRQISQNKTENVFFLEYQQQQTNSFKDMLMAVEQQLAKQRERTVQVERVLADMMDNFQETKRLEYINQKLQQEIAKLKQEVMKLKNDNNSSHMSAQSFFINENDDQILILKQMTHSATLQQQQPIITHLYNQNLIYSQIVSIYQPAPNHSLFKGNSNPIIQPVKNIPNYSNQQRNQYNEKNQIGNLYQHLSQKQQQKQQYQENPIVGLKFLKLRQMKLSQSISLDLETLETQFQPIPNQIHFVKQSRQFSATSHLGKKKDQQLKDIMERQLVQRETPFQQENKKFRIIDEEEIITKKEEFLQKHKRKPIPPPTLIYSPTQKYCNSLQTEKVNSLKLDKICKQPPKFTLHDFGQNAQSQLLESYANNEQTQEIIEYGDIDVVDSEQEVDQMSQSFQKSLRISQLQIQLKDSTHQLPPPPLLEMKMTYSMDCSLEPFSAEQSLYHSTKQQQAQMIRQINQMKSPLLQHQTENTEQDNEKLGNQLVQ